MCFRWPSTRLPQSVQSEPNPHWTSAVLPVPPSSHTPLLAKKHLLLHIPSPLMNVLDSSSQLGVPTSLEAKDATPAPAGRAHALSVGESDHSCGAGNPICPAMPIFPPRQGPREVRPFGAGGAPLIDHHTHAHFCFKWHARRALACCSRNLYARIARRGQADAVHKYAERVAAAGA